MKKIIILDCCSTASNYIKDILDEGLCPVLMEFKLPAENYKRARELHDFYYSLNGDPLPEIISAGETYEETLEIVKKISPIIILAGSDKAIEWATRLAYDLSLPSNNPRNLPYMRNKFKMQQIISEYGLRSIKSKLIHTFQEALDFYHILDNEYVVVKPVNGNATIGVCICKNETELRNAIEFNLSIATGSKFHITPSILVQEYIDGTEYVVNSASCRGKHIILSTMEYDKILIPGRGKIYNYVKIVSPSEEKIKQVINYALLVLDVIGLEFGPSHIELIVDKHGPVLVETNCRPCGGMMRRMWLEKFLPHHETNICLDSYLHPDKFLKYPLCFEPTSNAIIKPIIVTENVYAIENNLGEIASRLESFVYEMNMGGGKTYSKTIDFSTNGGFVYLCHSDMEVIMRDCMYLHNIEINSPEKLFVQ